MMGRRLPLRWLATVLTAIALAADIAAVALIIAIGQAGGEPPGDVYTVGGIAVGAAYAIVGWLIASRRPENSIGWIFLVIALSQTGSAFTSTCAIYAFTVGPPGLPLAVELSWVAVWAWVPGYVLLVTLSVLLFPDGRPPSPRWRPVVWASFIAMALLAIPGAVATWPRRGATLLGSLDGLPGMDVAVAAQAIGIALIPLLSAASIAGMVVRFRRAGQTERQQLKWFTIVAVPELVFVVASGYVEFSAEVAVVAAIFIAPLVPVAAAIAIFRYRLYDIDRLVSRTIAWTVVTGLLIATYAVAILVLTGPLGRLFGGDTISVALSTLAVAALFQPIRRRVQRSVDRRFDRARYDGDLTVAAFAARLRDDVDLEHLRLDLDATVRSAIAPQSVGIWIRAGRR